MVATTACGSSVIAPSIFSIVGTAGTTTGSGQHDGFAAGGFESVGVDGAAR